MFQHEANPSAGRHRNKQVESVQQCIVLIAGLANKPENDIEKIEHLCLI